MSDDLSGVIVERGVARTVSGDEVRRLLRGETQPARTSTESPARERLLRELDALGFVREVPFRGLSGKRRFRFDAALLDGDGERIVIGVDYHGFGASGAHQYRGKQAGDHEKVSEAALCGLTYIVCDAISVGSGKCQAYVKQAMEVA